MFVFPQLFSGAVGQFPIVRRRMARTVVNQSAEGYQVKLADPGAAITAWHLSLEELSDQELAAIEALFQSVEGRLTPFTFVDPTDNALAWSEQQNQPVWQGDPLLTLTGGVADPAGGTAAWQVSNPTAAILKLQQTTQAPAGLEYCLSLYARSDAAQRVWLNVGTTTVAMAIGPVWSRLTLAARAQGGDTTSFGIALDAGTAIDVYGFQAEAQPAASEYKRTTTTGGVYPNARFLSDTLRVETDGPGRHGCELDIVNVEHL